MLNPEQKVARFSRYQSAMARYNRLKHYFTRGQFTDLGGDETLHLHTLPDQPGGVLLLFNLSGEPVARIVRVPLAKLNLKASAAPPAVTGATGSVDGDQLVLKLELGPESPALVEIMTR
jgi:hypothetical protein